MSARMKKTRGFNLLKKMLAQEHGRGKYNPRLQVPKDDWLFFPGDTVEIVQGRRDVGKTGKILSCVKDRNQVFVEGLNRGIKHMKPTPQNPEGGRIEKEMAVQYENVRLVDPVYGRATPVEWRTFDDPATAKQIRRRVALLSEQIIPVPEAASEFPDTEGPRDTPRELVEARSYVPNVFAHPFPNAVRNEMLRLERKGKKPERVFWM